MKLTKLEKTILENLNKSQQFKTIERDDMNGLILWQKDRKDYRVYTDFNMFCHLFTELETDKEYSIEELLENE